MSITLNLPINIENALLEKAEAKKQDLESVIIEYLNDKISHDVNESLDLRGMLVDVRKRLEEAKKRPKTDLVSMVGSGVHCSSFKSMEEANDFINELRNEWR